MRSATMKVKDNPHRVESDDRCCMAESKEVDNPGATDLSTLLTRYKVDEEWGLDADMAEAKLAEIGPNEISYRTEETALQLIWRQLKSSVVILLLVAAAISFCTNDILQAIGILIAVVINTMVGFFIERRAQVSLSTLAKIAGPTARVLRSGQEIVLPARQLVPGDIIILSAGIRVPADLRLLEALSLSVDESIVTGESVPAAKSAESVAGEDPNCTLALHGTHVLSGRGKGIVIATGARSSLGKLQCSLMEGHSIPTPLELKLEELGKQMSILTVIICVLIALLGLFYKYDIWTMLDAGIALAVAAIPEGLPVVATLALAVGTLRMVRAGALIRQLAAVETLGCTTVICVDKTGTLTENKLQVTDIFADDRQIKLSGSGYDPSSGDITCGGEVYDTKLDAVIQTLLRAAVLCNDATLHNDNNKWTIKG